MGIEAALSAWGLVEADCNNATMAPVRVDQSSRAVEHRSVSQPYLHLDIAFDASAVKVFGKAILVNE